MKFWRQSASEVHKSNFPSNSHQSHTQKFGLWLHPLHTGPGTAHLQAAFITFAKHPSRYCLVQSASWFHRMCNGQFWNIRVKAALGEVDPETPYLFHGLGILHYL